MSAVDLGQLLSDAQALGRNDADDDQIRRIFVHYGRRLLAFFLKRDPATAEDLTQETFIRVFRSKAGFDSLEEFEAWLFTIATNLHRNAVRSRQAQKRAANETSLDTVDETRSAGIPDVAFPGKSQSVTDPLAEVLGKEERTRLEQAVASLPDQMRVCLILRLHQDLKYREIAAVMKISIETVKAHLYQARKRLERELRVPTKDARGA